MRQVKVYPVWQNNSHLEQHKNNASFEEKKALYEHCVIGFLGSLYIYTLHENLRNFVSSEFTTEGVTIWWTYISDKANKKRRPYLWGSLLEDRIEDNIKKDFTDRSYSNVDGIDLARDVLWQDIVSVVLILPDLLS